MAGAAAPAAAGAGSAALNAGLGAGGSLLSGIGSALLQKGPKDEGGHTPIPSGSVGQLGVSGGRGGAMFSGRPDMAVPNRQSMAMELLRRGGY